MVQNRVEKIKTPSILNHTKSANHFHKGHLANHEFQNRRVLKQKLGPSEKWFKSIDSLRAVASSPTAGEIHYGVRKAL